MFLYFVHVYTCMYMYMCMYVCIHACMYVCMYIRMYVCMHVHKSFSGTIYLEVQTALRFTTNNNRN